MTKSVANPPARLHEARKKLEEIMAKASKGGFDLTLFPATQRLLGKSGGHSGDQHSGYRVFLILALLLTALAYATNIHTLQGFSSFWLKWNYGSVREELCTIPMPDGVVKIFRPPVSCSMCKGVTKVEKIANLSPKDFEERYAYTGRPVVVTDGMTNWTAQHVFGFDFFKKIYSKRMDKWRLHNCQFFPYETEFKHLSEVFNMSAERTHLAEGTRSWYVGWSNCDDEINQILRRHYEKPYFLPETAETKKLDWIFMGSSGYGAPMHVDNVEHPSWQAQLRGRKKWTLQPPPECFYVCDSVQVVVEPGEIRHLTKWWTEEERRWGVCLSWRPAPPTQDWNDFVPADRFRRTSDGHKQVPFQSPRTTGREYRRPILSPHLQVVLDTNRWYHSTLIVSKEISVTIGAEYD